MRRGYTGKCPRCGGQLILIFDGARCDECGWKVTDENTDFEQDLGY